MRGTVVSLAVLGMALGAPVTTVDQQQQGGGGGSSSIITIGKPWTTGPVPSLPGTGGCDQKLFEKTGFCILPGDMEPSTRKERRGGGGADLNLPGDKNSELKEAIRQAELELQKLQAKDSKTRADWKRIEALEYFIRKTAGVISISPPDGGSTILVPGKARRDGAGPASSNPCLVDLQKHAKQLQDFLLSFPPWERASIWTQLIEKICGIKTGPIIPDPITPGSPMKPDPISTGDHPKPGKL